MKNLGNALVLPLALAFVLPVLPIGVSAQDTQSSALGRGYRTGYSDGYQAGYRDAIDRAARDFRAKVEYQRADRAYTPAFGSIEDYRDGYQKGFEIGYGAGYERRGFDSTVPPDLKRRGQIDTDSNSNPSYPTDANKAPGTTTRSGSPVLIPRDSVMTVELLGSVSTNLSHPGDPFQARVVEPKDFQGATVDGHVTNVKRPHKGRGVAELQLSFEQIHTPDGRSANISAQVIEVIPMSSSEGVGKVDPEGGVHGKSSTKSDVAKVGAVAGVGAVVGLIFGGGTGAAIGAGAGAGVGTVNVMRKHGKDIHLYQGQQLRIRTAGDASLQ